MTRQFEPALPLIPLGLRRQADQAFEIRERAFKMYGINPENNANRKGRRSRKEPEAKKAAETAAAAAAGAATAPVLVV